MAAWMTVEAMRTIDELAALRKTVRELRRLWAIRRDSTLRKPTFTDINRAAVRGRVTAYDRCMNDIDALMAAHGIDKE